MPHMLLRTSKDDGKPHLYESPFMVTMRYQCECTGGEVVQISTVFNLDMVKLGPDLGGTEVERKFLWTMKRMLKDMQIEVEQHLKRQPAAPP